MANSQLSQLPKARRITIDLKAPVVKELDKLRDSTGLTTAELFRYAFNLLRIYVDVTQHGGELQLVEPKKEDRVVLLPFTVSETEGE